MQAFQEEKLSENCLLTIFADEDPESPREWDNLGVMTCFHGRYNLGDETDLRSAMFNGWDELREHLEKEEGALHILPLFLMDHSGLTMSTGSFGCPWDSGQVGFIYTTAEKMKEMGTDEDNIEACLKAEVETYSQYLSGDVWGYVLYELKTCDLGHVHKEETDSCWGFYGVDAAVEAGKEARNG
jgi:hypothetical protein